MMPPQLQATALLLLIAMTCHESQAEQTPNQPEPLVSGSLPGLESRTLGGMQLWSDQLVFHEWRIQQHAVTRHFRLLDGNNIRRALGTFSHCQAALGKYKQELDLPPIAGKVVVLLHGLGRSRGSLRGLAAYVREHSDYLVLSVSYASTRHDIGYHAKSLASVISHLPDAEEVNFVAHSMGNLVIRHYLGDCEGDDVDELRGRIGRVVMMGPPNQGAVLAYRLRDFRAFQILSGAGGRQIADWDSVTDKLTIPKCDFGIIAGGTGRDRGYNPLIKGDNDLIVSVAETKLPGARDFVVVPSWHTTMMDHSLARQYTLRFLQHGYFRSAAEQTPIADTPQ